MEAPFSLSPCMNLNPSSYFNPYQQVTFICSGGEQQKVFLGLFSEWPHLEKIFNSSHPIKISLSETTFFLLLNCLGYLSNPSSSFLITSFLEKNLKNLSELYELNQFAHQYQMEELMICLEDYIKVPSFLGAIQQKQLDDLYAVIYSNRENETDRLLAKKIIVQHLFFHNQFRSTPALGSKKEIENLTERYMRSFDLEAHPPVAELFACIESLLSCEIPSTEKALNFLFITQSHILNFFKLKAAKNLPFSITISSIYTDIFYSLFHVASQIQTFTAAEYFFNQLLNLTLPNLEFTPLKAFEKKLITQEIKFSYPFSSQKGALFCLLFNEIVKNMQSSEIGPLVQLFFRIIHTCEKPKSMFLSLIDVLPAYVVKILALQLEAVDQIQNYLRQLERIMRLYKELKPWMEQNGGNADLLIEAYGETSPKAKLALTEKVFLDNHALVEKILEYRRHYHPIFLTPVVRYIYFHLSLPLKLKNTLLLNFPFLEKEASNLPCLAYSDLTSESPLTWAKTRPPEVLSHWLGLNDRESHQTFPSLMQFAIQNLNLSHFQIIFLKLKNEPHLMRVFYENIIHLFKNRFVLEPSYSTYQIIFHYGIPAIEYLQHPPQDFIPALETLVKLKLLEAMKYIEFFFTKFGLKKNSQPSFFAAKMLLGEIEEIESLLKPETDLSFLNQTLTLLQNEDKTFVRMPDNTYFKLIRYAQTQLKKWSVVKKESAFPSFYFFLLSEHLHRREIKSAQVLRERVLKEVAEAHLQYLETLLRHKLTHLDSTLAKTFFRILSECPHAKKALKQWAIQLAHRNDTYFFKNVVAFFFDCFEAKKFLNYIYIFQGTFIKHLKCYSQKEFHQFAFNFSASLDETLPLAYRTFKKSQLISSTRQTPLIFK
ncbi:hypothetical protein [Parachlamydia sp. AcF125]|uniref:hypothetical protein n=1 Tax=Parachlamydia sp. AcF125 TaxID=2795736 RepID=UPI001BC8FEB9|nr:hypothetical protein [Parachlamydia sp. AcF125]MBS4168540.1 hypothetical protein [Parachlamydia sp. AcF125]